MTCYNRNIVICILFVKVMSPICKQKLFTYLDQSTPCSSAWATDCDVSATVFVVSLACFWCSLASPILHDCVHFMLALLSIILITVMNLHSVFLRCWVFVVCKKNYVFISGDDQLLPLVNVLAFGWGKSWAIISLPFLSDHHLAWYSN